MAQVNRVAPFLGFIFGTPFLGPAFEAIFVLELASQAYSFYRWANCIPPDNILVNMDECSLAVHVEGCRGTVLRSVRGAVRASLSTQRSRMTLLASVSTDFGFNAILPQVIYHCQQDPVYEVLGSSYRFTRASEVGSCGVQRMTGHLFLAPNVDQERLSHV